MSIGHVAATWRQGFILPIAVMTAAFLFACERTPSDRVQGYVEGEFVYIASPFAGALESLSVQRGRQVRSGDALFALERGSEKAARDEAERRLGQALANVEDAKKGKRPSEIDSLKAQLKHAQAALRLSTREVVRQEGLSQVPGAAVELEVDRARAARDQDRQRVAQLQADLDTALLGSRTDQVIAAEAEVHAREAALARADWEFAQKRQQAPKSGLVFDTLYREGEWVPAGRPVVVLLPPENIKVRAFVSETRVGTIRPGDNVQVAVDGVPKPFTGKVSYISPRAEYTPPVIYSQESRDKLVFMVEVVFDPQSAVNLNPGQPVDVRFESTL
ncbi:MAG TPA: HlyD family efflux transporter periplasmic adaptor subunit [Nitrospira sp.]|nr:HlyD family efflux transporter periplasmic adaptor subunit [Nitrospira sp.]